MVVNMYQYMRKGRVCLIGVIWGNKQQGAIRMNVWWLDSVWNCLLKGLACYECGQSCRGGFSNGVVNVGWYLWYFLWGGVWRNPPCWIRQRGGVKFVNWFH